MKNHFVLLFSLGAFLYVAVEAAIYVWMPTLLAGYNGPGKWIAIYSISIFFCFEPEAGSSARGC